MDALRIFHPKSEDQWLEDVKPYMARVVWFANDFESIKVVSKQLAILYPSHRDDFNDQGDKASSMLMRAEIEADQASQKPWQRSAAPKLKRSVRTGPVSRNPKKQQADDSEEKN
jgi:L-asparaginase II